MQRATSSDSAQNMYFFELPARKSVHLRTPREQCSYILYSLFSVVVVLLGGAVCFETFVQTKLLVSFALLVRCRFRCLFFSYSFRRVVSESGISVVGELPTSGPKTVFEIQR